MIRDFKEFELKGHRTFVKAVIEPPFRIMASMDNEACFYYILKGHSRVLGHNKTIVLQPQEGLVMQCGTYLNDYLTREDYQECEAIAVHLHEDLLRWIYATEFPEFLADVKAVAPAAYNRLKASSLLQKYIESLLFYFENPELVTEELLKLKVRELVLLLARTDNADQIKMLLSGLFSKSTIDFRKTIERHIFENLSVTELAGLTRLSVSSFKREFARHYADSPARYIRKRRLERASSLIRSTDMRISDIAFETGFADLPHFSKVFHKHFGHAPSLHKKQK